jgi:hypothetical protein
MKTKQKLTILALLTGLLSVADLQAELRHRYSFNEAVGTTNVDDSVGTADGVLAGNGAGFDGSGQLNLPGGTGSGAPAEELAGYVDLPNGIISQLTNMTVEAWVTWQGAGLWQRVFDFGTSAGGENISDGNGNYLFLTTMGPAYIRFAVRDPAAQVENVQATASAMLEAGSEVCLTVTYDYDGNVSRVYSNGVQIASSVASTPLRTVQDVNNWLGRSQWNDDMFLGTYNEFRIYDNAMTGLEVAASYVSGAANPSTDVAALGTLQAVHLNAAKTVLREGDTQDPSPTGILPWRVG